jgi:hypothetical protein
MLNHILYIRTPHLLYVHVAVAACTQCSFTENLATTGSAVAAQASDPSAYDIAGIVTVSDSVFANNTADVAGTVYTVGLDRVTLTGCTFDTNTARDGAGCYISHQAATTSQLSSSNSRGLQVITLALKDAAISDVSA